ncbi:MAG: hypothetical protein ABJG47_15480 [Ekhidna sp.]
MKFYIRLITLIAFLATISSQAQIAPSPGAMSTINLSNSEDLYRAQVTEGVPIYTIEAENGYQVPVQLTYQTRGIKVDDVASSVGLGWDLFAGGAITRVMKDEPDDQSFFVETPSATSVRHSEYDKQAGRDYQKDIFYFSFPGGGGSFVSSGKKMNTNLTENSDFYGLPYTDVNIKFFRTSSTNSYWELTDTQGVVYRYGMSPEAREITSTESYESGQPKEDNARFTYISTWYLEEIRFPNLPATSSIVFDYEKNDNYINMVSSSKSIVFDLVEDKTYWYYGRLEGDESFADYFTLRRQDRFAAQSFTYTVPNYGNVPVPGSTAGPSINNVPGLYDYKLFEKVCVENADPQKQECYQTFNGGSWTHGSFADNFIDNLVNTGNTTDYTGGPFVTYKKSPNPPHSEKLFITSTDIYTSNLVSIKSLKADVIFNNQPRQSRPGLSRIQNIIIKDHQNREVFNYELGHEYFDSRDHHENNLGLDVSYTKRLKLSYINRNGQFYRSFNYINESDPSYELPPWGSGRRDKYGYYKRSVNSPYSPYTVKYGISEPFEFVYDIPIDYGVNREPNADTKANMLWKVNYPTGGYKEFAFGTKAGGGAAITWTKLKDENDEVVSHISYKYGNPRIMEAGLHVVGNSQVTFFSSSPYLTFDHQSLAGYEFATVNDVVAKTSVKYRFRSPIVTDESAKSKWQLNGSSWTDLNDKKVTKGSSPMMSPPMVFGVGLPRYIEAFDAEGNPTNYTSYGYSHGDVEQTIEEHAFLQSSENGGHFYQGKSPLKLRTFNLSSTHNISYEGDHSTRTRTTYSYHDTFKTLLDFTTTYAVNQNNDPITDRDVVNTRSTIYYPSDADAIRSFYGEESTTLNKLVNKHMIGIPVATVKEVDLPNDGHEGYWVNGVSFSKYTEKVVDASNKFLLPTTQHQYIITHPEEEWYSEFHSEIIATTTYNNEGLLASKTGQNEIVTSYAYDDYGYMKSMTVDPGVEDLKRTTSYTYYPLVGLDALTGPNGRVVTYEYDNQKRLLLTRDNEGNILKRYRYNFVTQSQEALRVSIDISSGYNVVNRPINLLAVVSGSDYGSVSYRWGDGSTNSSRRVTYSTPGNKTTSVSITNLEHPDVKKSAARSIDIHAEIADLKLNGPIWVEYCPGDTFDDGFSGGSEGSSGPSVDYGTQNSFFGAGFEVGARCLNYGYKERYMEYSKDGGSTWTRFASEEGLFAQLPLSAFHYSSVDYTILVRATYKDNCGGKFEDQKSIAVKRCTSSGNSGGGNGSAWTVGISQMNSNLCPSGTPSSTQLTVASSGNHNCSDPSLSYTWEYKKVSESTWDAWPLLGVGPASLNVTRSVLAADDPDNPQGSWDIRVTVTDDCGETRTATSRVNIVFDCSSGDGGTGGTGGIGDGDPGNGGSGDGTIDPGNGGGLN